MENPRKLLSAVVALFIVIVSCTKGDIDDDILNTDAYISAKLVRITAISPESLTRNEKAYMKTNDGKIYWEN